MDDRRRTEQTPQYYSFRGKWKQTLLVTAVVVAAALISESVILPIGVALIALVWLTWPELKQARAALSALPKSVQTEDRRTVAGLVIAQFWMTGALAAVVAVPLLVAGLHPRDLGFWLVFGPIIGLSLALDVWFVLRALRAAG